MGWLGIVVCPMSIIESYANSKVPYPKWLKIHDKLVCTPSEAIYTAMLRVGFYI